MESCNIPDNTFSGLDIIVPEELKSGIISETQSKMSECFIDSLNLQSGSNEYLSFVKIVLQSIGARGKYTKIDFNKEFIDYFISLTISAFKDNNPKEYKRLRLNPQDSYIVINGVSINFHDRFEYYDPSVSVKPVGRPKKHPNTLNTANFSNLEGESGFQRSKNGGMTLSQAYEQLGFPESLKKGINILISDLLDEKTELSNIQFEQLRKLTEVVKGIESHGGYNVVLNDKVRTSGYYQFQVFDGKWGKEVFDFTTKTFSSQGLWKNSDNERKVLKGSQKTWVRKVRNYSSYEQALLSLPNSVLGEYPNLLKQSKLIGKPNHHKPEKLSSDEQTLLFLSNISTKGGSRSKQLFLEILAGNDISIIELYREIHHADKTNPNTLKTVKRVVKDVLGIEYL